MVGRLRRRNYIIGKKKEKRDKKAKRSGIAVLSCLQKSPNEEGEALVWEFPVSRAKGSGWRQTYAPWKKGCPHHYNFGRGDRAVQRSHIPVLMKSGEE